MNWLRRLLHPESPPLRVETLDSTHARRVAELHHQGGFARGWEPGECAALICDRAVVADGAFLGDGPHPAAFVMSRIAADEAEILSIVVAARHRGAGLAGALLAAHARGLADRRVARLFLEVEEGNLAALGLYRRLGFGEVGRREAYYPKSDGSRAAALCMRLDIA